MTDTKYLDEAARLAGYDHWKDACKRAPRTTRDSIRAHAATLEREANLRQEVSEAVVTYNDNWRNGTPGRDVFLTQFARFIIPTPDPIETACRELGIDREELARRGVKLVECE